MTEVTRNGAGRNRIIAVRMAFTTSSAVLDRPAPIVAAEKAERDASFGYRRELLIAAVLLLTYVLQCAWFVATQSITFDESIHTAVGQDVWRNHRFDAWMETPPLGHLLLGLPIIPDRYQMEIHNPNGWLWVTALRPGPEQFIRGPRLVNIGLGVLLGVLVWCAVRNLLSAGAASFALALFAFTPQFIAHFSVVTVDGIGVLTVFVVAFQLVRWRRNPSWGNTLLLGVSFGLAVLAKFYAPPFLALAVLVMLLTRVRREAGEGSSPFRWHPETWSWKPALGAIAVAILVVWSGYFFHVGKARLQSGQITISYGQAQDTIDLGSRTALLSGLDISFPLPASEFFVGIHELWEHNQFGHPSFLLGKVYRTVPPHWYFPVAVALKWPTITLLLALAGVVLVVVSSALRWGSRSEPELAIYGGFGAVALLLAMWARIGIGDRHVLTLYPFLLIFAAACWKWACDIGPSGKRRMALAAMVVLALLNAADVLRYAPGYLSYFNPFVAPERSHELLTDSSLDWGQGLVALRDYQRDHPDRLLHVAYFGSVDPKVYGIQFVPLAPDQHVTGTVVVSATMLSGQYLSDPSSYRWLLQFKPVAILDHCLFVYEVPNGAGG